MYGMKSKNFREMEINSEIIIDDISLENIMHCNFIFFKMVKRI